MSIEVDQFLIGNLNRLKKKNPNLDVICGDILETDLAAVANGRRMRIYGSLPYYITSPILHHLFQFAELIDEIHVVVQTEVAERMAAEPGSKSYGYLSVATQLNSRPELVLGDSACGFFATARSWVDFGDAAVAWWVGGVATRRRVTGRK